MRDEHHTSLGRLARTFQEPRSSVGRWVAAETANEPSRRRRPVGDDPVLGEAVRQEALRPRQQGYGYRRITAVLRRRGGRVNRKTVYRIMKEDHLLQDRIWHRPQRPRRVDGRRGMTVRTTRRATVPLG